MKKTDYATDIYLSESRSFQLLFFVGFVLKTEVKLANGSLRFYFFIRKIPYANPWLFKWKPVIFFAGFLLQTEIQLANGFLRFYFI